MFRGKSWGHGNTQRPVHPSAQTPWIAIPRNSISLASHATMARNNSAIGPSSPSVSQHRAAPLGVGLADLRVSPPHPTKINRKWIAKKKIQERFRSASLFSQPCIQYLVIKKRYWPFVAHNFGTSGDSSERWVATCRASFRIHPKRVDLFFKSLMLLQAQIYKGKTCGLMRIVVKENWWKLLRRVTGL